MGLFHYVGLVHCNQCIFLSTLAIILVPFLAEAPLKISYAEGQLSLNILNEMKMK